MEEGAARPGLREALAVWALFGAVGLSVLVTYARLPPEQLYHVDDDGLAGSLGRLVVFLNWPTALAAIALVLLAIDRLDDHRFDALAVAVIVLCAAVALPGVVDQDDLDVRPVNAIPAAGVAGAALLTALALRRGDLGVRAGRSPGDRARVVLALVLLAAGLPWWFAELGLYADDVPGLATLFMSDEIVPEPGEPTLRAVHLGEHHGGDGVFLALTALLLSRQLGWMSRRRLRVALAAYLSLALAYGVANAFQDFWNEQLVKRGTTDVEIPSLLRPSFTLAWCLVVAAAVAIYALLLRRAAASDDRR